MSLLSAVLQESEKANSAEFKQLRTNLLQKIKETNEKIQLLTWALQESLTDTYYTFVVSKSLEQINYKYRKENIHENYDKIQNQIAILETKFTTFDEEFKKSYEKLKESLGLLNDLCLAVESKRKLDKADNEFRRYNYSEAMLSISELRNQLKKLNLEDKLGKALKNIITQAETQYSLYAASVSLEWEDIFSWSEQKGVYHITYSLSVQQSDPAVIKNVLKTLYKTERLNFELSTFSEFFLNNLLNNVIHHNCEIFTEDMIAPNHTIVFNIKIDLEDSTVPTYQAVFTNLMAVFDFLQSTLGARLECEDQTFIGVFANSIRDKFFDKIIEDCIRNNLPSCDSSYENYKNLVVELDSFNKFLIELKFVSSEESPLNKFVKDTECVLYKKKCDKLMSEVRHLLGDSLSYGTTLVGTTEVNDNDLSEDFNDSSLWDITRPLYLPRCAISRNVMKVMDMIVEHLKESAKLPERYGNQLVNYIRNIAVLYQCIVPKKFQVNLEHCPLDIALFFNNCFYLAHGLIGPPWKTILPQPFADQLTLVLLESVQDLRVLGLEKMSLYLQKQKTNITNSIHPEEIQQWSEETYEQFDCAINEALTLMKDLKQNWYNILPNKMYSLSLCTLIQALCTSVLDRMFANNKIIDEYLVYKIAGRLESAIEDIYELFYKPIDFDKKIEAWSKFKKLPLILKAQLLEISRLWTTDKELSSAYTCEEVRQLIKMRFPDDKFRLKILVEIK